MVIAKIHQNSSARATLKYVLSKSGASVIGGNAADWVERDPLTQAQLATHIDTATAQLQQAIALKSLARPLYHISLSLPPQEVLDDAQLCAFAEQYLAGLILSAEQPDLLKALSEPEFKAALERFRDEELYKYCYTLVRHTDQPHPHVHLVIAKTNLETEKTMPTSYDRYRSQIVLRYLERQHGLAVQPHSWEVGQKAESTQQAQTTLKTGQPSVHKQLQTILEQAAAKSQTVPAFIEQVQAAGVEVRVQFTRTGKSKGISYSWQGVALAGNALGTRYSFKQGEPGLVKNLGLSYEPERDRSLIQALCERSLETLKTAPQEGLIAVAQSLEMAQQQHQAWVSQVAAEAETERLDRAEQQVQLPVPELATDAATTTLTNPETLLPVQPLAVRLEPAAAPPITVTEPAVVVPLPTTQSDQPATKQDRIDQTALTSQTEAQAQPQIEPLQSPPLTPKQATRLQQEATLFAPLMVQRLQQLNTTTLDGEHVQLTLEGNVLTYTRKADAAVLLQARFVGKQWQAMPSQGLPKAHRQSWEKQRLLLQQPAAKPPKKQASGPSLGD